METRQPVIIPNKINSTLEDFGAYYRVVGKHMIRLCLMAYELEQEDHKSFWTYALVTMKASKSTISAMVRAGKLYYENYELLELQVPYTKVFELSPVSEQVPAFLDDLGGAEELNNLSQKEIRANVKKYVKEAKEAIEMEPPAPEPEEVEEPEQLGFAETMNRKKIIEILSVIISAWQVDHKMKLDRSDIESLKYIIKEVQKEV